TGSNGKTTTKDMLAHLLSTRYKTYKTQGNYNNEIGLPYTVLHMPEGTEKLVLEMGQDHLGDIHLLSELARPKTAIVTLVRLISWNKPLICTTSRKQKTRINLK
ncbi:Mur ligase family protein, partial [Streptococcus pneumoniae]|uniref:Mur ligase family protein n=1 Tax=Streptococcus pneumoniae TaxID=1313 RepID=UPI00345258E7